MSIVKPSESNWNEWPTVHHSEVPFQGIKTANQYSVISSQRQPAEVFSKERYS